MSSPDLSLQLEQVTKKRGRPSTGLAKSGADRVREHRARKRAEAGQGEGWVKQSDYDDVCRTMRYHLQARWSMEKTIAAMQNEQALLIAERARLFEEVDRLRAELNACTRCR